MPAINIPEAKAGLGPEQCTVRNLLIENGQLIETAAEYQRMGKIEDSIKYQELLHKNLIFLSQLADPYYASQMMQEIGPSQTKGHSSTENVPAEKAAHPANLSPNGTLLRNTKEQQPQLLVPPANGQQPLQQSAPPTQSLQQQQPVPHLQRTTNANAHPTPTYCYGQQQQQNTNTLPHHPSFIYGQPGQGVYNGGYNPQQQQTAIYPPVQGPDANQQQTHQVQAHQLQQNKNAYQQS